MEARASFYEFFLTKSSESLLDCIPKYWNIVESGIKNHKPQNPPILKLLLDFIIILTLVWMIENDIVKSICLCLALGGHRMTSTYTLELPGIY
jgi:hypothetical protein